MLLAPRSVVVAVTVAVEAAQAHLDVVRVDADDLDLRPLDAAAAARYALSVAVAAQQLAGGGLERRIGERVDAGHLGCGRQGEVDGPADRARAVRGTGAEVGVVARECESGDHDVESLLIRRLVKRHGVRVAGRGEGISLDADVGGRDTADVEERGERPDEGENTETTGSVCYHVTFMAGPRSQLQQKRQRPDLRAIAAVFEAFSAFSALVAPTVARADEPKRPLAEAIRLGPSQCLDAKRVAEHTSLWLRRRDIDRRLSIEVADTPEGVRFIVRNEETVLGERTLEVKKVPCEEIQAALGLGIAAAIDATVLPSLGVPAPTLPSPAPTPPAPSIAAPSPPVALALVLSPPVLPSSSAPPPLLPPRKGWTPILTTTVQGLVLVEVLPKVVLGASPAVELTVARGFDIRAAGLATGTTTLQIGVGTASVGLVGGLLDACAAIVVLDIVRLRGCGGVSAGVVSVASSGYSVSRSARAPWVAPRVRVDGRWAITRVFGLVVGVDGFFPGLKPELQVFDTHGDVVAATTFPLAGVGISLGPSLTF
jgi:hypothetical protein